MAVVISKAYRCTAERWLKREGAIDAADTLIAWTECHGSGPAPSPGRPVVMPDRATLAVGRIIMDRRGLAAFAGSRHVVATGRPC